MTVTQNVPGDIHIISISIYAGKGVVNLVEHIQTIKIFESILSPGIVCEMTMLDTRNLISELPILGGERITIEFETPGRKVAKYTLYINAIKETVVSDNLRTKASRIIATSEEMISNKAVQIAKSYNTNISSIVKDVLKGTLKTSKKVDVQDTRGSQKVILPNIYPFDAIKMLRQMASSVSDKTSSYVFFENRDGFNFKTIESLLTQSDTSDRNFYLDATAPVDLKQAVFRNVIEHSRPKQFDVIDRFSDGGLSREIQKFDFKTLKYTSTVEKFTPGDYKNADGTLKSPDGSNILAKYSGTSGKNHWVAHDSSNPNTFIPDSLGKRKLITSLYSQGAMSMTVFGDSELMAGQVINVDLVENSTVTEAPDFHRQYSGKYIIASISHVVAPEGTMPRYFCDINCLKCGYKDLK